MKSSTVVSSMRIVKNRSTTQPRPVRKYAAAQGREPTTVRLPQVLQSPQSSKATDWRWLLSSADRYIVIASFLRSLCRRHPRRIPWASARIPQSFSAIIFLDKLRLRNGHDIFAFLTGVGGCNGKFKPGACRRTDQYLAYRFSHLSSSAAVFVPNFIHIKPCFEITGDLMPNVAVQSSISLDCKLISC